MRSINVWFEDEEIRILKEAKKNLTWHDFIMKNAIKDE